MRGGALRRGGRSHAGSHAHGALHIGVLEGISNNRAIEIYNGTGAPVNLAAGGYNVQMFFNGSATAGLTINLTGTVANGDVFVIAHSGAAPDILSRPIRPTAMDGSAAMMP